MRMFGLTASLFPTGNNAPTFWPGGQVVISMIESNEYKKLSLSRLDKVRLISPIRRVPRNRLQISSVPYSAMEYLCAHPNELRYAEAFFFMFLRVWS